MPTGSLNPLTTPGWDDLVLTAGEYSFFHSSAWIRVLCESYGYKPVFFAVYKNGGLSSVLPLLEVNSFLTGRRAVSLPFSDYCEPLLFGDASLTAIPDGLIDFSRNWKHIDFRAQTLFTPDVPVYSRYVRHTLKLSTPEQLLSGLHKNTARNLKKARASGLQIEVSGSFEATREYYKLHCLTRKRQATPPQPFSFFRKIYEHVFLPDKGRVILAYHEHKPIAGAVFFHLGKKAMYKFGASDLAYSALGGNAAIMWEAISRYALEGFDTFCFGRTDLDNEGLRRFKASFGATEEPLCYYRYDPKSAKFLAGRPDTGPHQFLRRLPMPLLRLAGELLYRHVG
ncbi:MAG: lipid II:glycine glycyltransferase FemX [Syntrophobacteraceae bacterium]